MKILHFYENTGALRHKGLKWVGTSRYRLFSSFLMAAWQTATLTLFSKVVGGPCCELPHIPPQHCSSTSHSSRYILPIGDLCGEHVGMWHPYTTNIVKATPQDQQCKTKPKET